MAGEKYTQRAVAKLAGYIRSNLPTYLRAVETDQSLTASSITDPVEVLEADAPHDSRSPLIQVYADRWSYEDYQYKLVLVSCTVAVGITGDADTDTLTTFVDRYITALLDCLIASSTLGSTVLVATLGDSERATARGDESISRQVFVQDVEVLLHEP
jgi:hypothetical protein